MKAELQGNRSFDSRDTMFGEQHRTLSEQSEEFDARSASKCPQFARVAITYPTGRMLF